MIITNILLGVSLFFLTISFLTAINPVEKIVILYGLTATMLAVIFSNLNLEQNILTDLILALILTKTLLLIIITKFRK